MAHPVGLNIACLLTAEAAQSILKPGLLQPDVERLWTVARAGLLHHYQHNNRIRPSTDNLYQPLPAEHYVRNALCSEHHFQITPTKRTDTTFRDNNIRWLWGDGGMNLH